MLSRFLSSCFRCTLIRVASCSDAERGWRLIAMLDDMRDYVKTLASEHVAFAAAARGSSCRRTQLNLTMGCGASISHRSARAPTSTSSRRRRRRSLPEYEPGSDVARWADHRAHFGVRSRNMMVRPRDGAPELGKLVALIQPIPHTAEPNRVLPVFVQHLEHGAAREPLPHGARRRRRGPPSRR